MMLKLAIASVPLLALVKAQSVEHSEQIANDIQAAVETACEEAENADNPLCADTRSFGSVWAQEIIQAINGYGCWCYFQNEHGAGKGSPVNEVDNQCKILHDGYTCILMDAEDEGKQCTPWDVKYNSASGLGLLAGGGNNNSLEEALRFKCKKANKKSNCAARACMVENYFVVRTVRLFLHGVVFDPSVKHSLGLFDPSIDCPTKDGIKSDKECCGSYPLRFPYKHLNGDRGCCGERTYNAAMLVCCDDGSVKVSC